MISLEAVENNNKSDLVLKSPFTLRVLAPRLHTLGGSPHHPNDRSENLSAHISAKSLANISLNPSEVISKVSEP